MEVQELKLIEVEDGYSLAIIISSKENANKLNSALSEKIKIATDFKEKVPYIVMGIFSVSTQKIIFSAQIDKGYIADDLMQQISEQKVKNVVVNYINEKRDIASFAQLHPLTY